MYSVQRNGQVKNKLISLLVAGILLLSGCGSNKVKNQVIGNMGDVKVVRLTSMRKNNILIANGYLHNTGNVVVQGYYRCLFFDVNQVPIGDAPAWKFVTLDDTNDEYGDVPVKCKASDATATDFKIEFSNSGINTIKYQ